MMGPFGQAVTAAWVEQRGHISWLGVGVLERKCGLYMFVCVYMVPSQQSLCIKCSGNGSGHLGHTW